jgi:hypothetical protein
MAKKFLIATILLFAVFSLFFGIEALADSGDNVSGWAWSGNIGWLSLNCTNEGVCGTSDYGININEDGTLTGYAWSEHVGWINFAPAGAYPASPSYSTKVDLATGDVSGWARALSYGDGWDGWIKMRGTDYGVSINFSSGEFSGYAWSDMVIGWLSFKGVDYGVITSFYPSPKIENLSNQFLAPCSQSRIPTFSWDTDAELPYDYEIQICSDLGCSTQLFSELKESTFGTSWAPTCTYTCNITPYNSVDFGGGTYYGQIRARNILDGGVKGEWSSWSDSSSFVTFNHAYPFVDFTWDPLSPSQEETVVFDPDSGDYGGSQTYDGFPLEDASFFWSITQGSGSFVDDTDAYSQYPHIQFSTSENKVKLRITDSSTYWCEREQSVTASLPLPEYKEIKPVERIKNLLVSAVFRIFN